MEFSDYLERKLLQPIPPIQARIESRQLTRLERIYWIIFGVLQRDYFDSENRPSAGHTRRMKRLGQLFRAYWAEEEKMKICPTPPTRKGAGLDRAYEG